LRYGFVIDHNRCIGCHACTVACKEEHNVPVGVFRTWVKYIEKGQFPHASRHFGVMRCNHCDDAPCVEICPTRALFRRDDGIVDFDNSRCIGCKSCMQACPYDALYLDPNTHTAAKCNFCAHRIEMNLEPACVIVCPTRAIIAGDIDNPDSNISQIIATGKVAARKPQKGTRPKLFYAGIEGDLLQPSMMEPQPSHIFAGLHPDAGQHPYRILSRKGEGEGSRINGRAATFRSNPGAARVVYDVEHPRPWGSIPAFYLWTKSIAAGVLMVAALLLGISSPHDGLSDGRLLFTTLAPGTALLFTGITSLLLIADLHRPERFYYILLKPNPRSWLVVGTWILIVYSILAAIWLAFGLVFNSTPRLPLVVAASLAGACSAGYSAFLFAQAKGRDLWQSPLFLWHLLVQAIVAGAALGILLAVFDGYPHIADASDGGRRFIWASNLMLLGGVVLSTLMVLGELWATPFSADIHYAAEMILHGRLRYMFQFGVLGMGAIIPGGILLYVSAAGTTSVPLEVLAAVLSLAGLLIFEKVWIDAGQAPPLS
jgi:Fe-S-cluster-containing dehydrogenase component/formate-dependent nitrite reductase membrane component NrfD